MCGRRVRNRNKIGSNPLHSILKGRRIELDALKISGSRSSELNISKYTHDSTVRAQIFRTRVQKWQKITRRTLTTERSFSELVILVVKGIQPCLTFRDSLSLYIYTRGVCDGEMTPTCGSAHARNGREGRKIESISATVLPKGAPINVHGWVWLGRERTKRPYTLHPHTLKAPWSSASIRLHTTKSCEYFRPIPTL